MNRRMRLALPVALCVVPIFIVGSIANAELVRQSHVADCSGDGVEHHLVYDVTNNTWWYPDLMHFANMTRREQNRAIEKLNQERYGNMDEWRMASAAQTNRMKESLAAMAPVENRIPWDFKHLNLGDPFMPDTTTEDRTVGSPKLAWPVHAERFFAPTEDRGYKLFGKIPALVFNGRVDESPAWRRNDDSSVTWSKGEADDHWMQLELANPGSLDTMLFNQDVHYLADDAKEHHFLVPGVNELGQVGAWVASENRPEELAVRTSFGEPRDGELAIRIPGREWLNVGQINAHQTKLASKLGDCTMKRYSIEDADGDGIDDLVLVVDTGCLKEGGPSVLTGLLKEKYGPVAIRSCDVLNVAVPGKAKPK